MFLLKYRLELAHNRRRLLRVRAASHAQMMIRVRNAEIAKKDVAHSLVVMLAGMH